MVHQIDRLYLRLKKSTSVVYLRMLEPYNRQESQRYEFFRLEKFHHITFFEIIKNPNTAFKTCFEFLISSLVRLNVSILPSDNTSPFLERRRLILTMEPSIIIDPKQLYL